MSSEFFLPESQAFIGEHALGVTVCPVGCHTIFFT